MMEVAVSAIAIAALIGMIVWLVICGKRFKTAKEHYVGVFSNKQVKNYGSYQLWPMWAMVALVFPAVALVFDRSAIGASLMGTLLCGLCSLFFVWRSKSIYSKARANCPEELVPGLNKAMIGVSWVYQLKSVFKIFGLAADIYMFNEVMKHGGTITITTTTTTKRDDGFS